MISPIEFELVWTAAAAETYRALESQARQSLENRRSRQKAKPSKAEGLFKQIHKTLLLLSENPRHPGLHTHAYASLPNPYASDQKAFEAYAQNKTPGAYRVFWCYGPNPRQITIIAITPHP